jgi:hypothetical protein
MRLQSSPPPVKNLSERREKEAQWVLSLQSHGGISKKKKDKI